MTKYIVCPHCKSNNVSTNIYCAECLRPIQSNLQNSNQIINVTTNQNYHNQQSSIPLIPSQPKTPLKPNIVFKKNPIQNTNLTQNYPNTVQSALTQGINYSIPINYPLVSIPNDLVIKMGSPQLEGQVTELLNSENCDKRITGRDVFHATLGIAMLFKSLTAGAMFLSGLGHPKPPLKVLMLRICDISSGKESEVRIDGDLLRGYPSIGDVVAFWGIFSNNILISKHGFNRKTGAELIIRS